MATRGAVPHHGEVHESLSPGRLAFLTAARRAVLATTAGDGTARLVPVCFVLTDGPRGLPAEAKAEAGAGAGPADAEAEAGPAEAGSAHVAWIPLDEKPKSGPDPRDLARVRDIVARPRVALLVDRWSEDWAELAWLRCTGTARLVEPGDLDTARHVAILAALRAKHPQYRDHALESRPLIAITIEAATAWGAIDS